MRLAYIQYVAQAECGFDDSVVLVETFAIADVDAAAVGTVVHKGAPHDRSRQRERHATPDETTPHHTTTPYLASAVRFTFRGPRERGKSCS